jgi:hypothetical protein
MELISALTAMQNMFLFYLGGKRTKYYKFDPFRSRWAIWTGTAAHNTWCV